MLFARTTAGQVVHAWQQPGAPNDWQWGGPVGGTGASTAGGAGTAVASDPGAVLAPDGDLTVFAATAAGQVLVTAQDSPGAAGWTAWAPLGGNCASAPVPFTSGGTLAVFCVTGTGTLAEDIPGTGAAGGGWSGWQQVSGAPAGLAGTPAVVTGPGGGTEVLVVAAGHLAVATRDPAGGGWTWSAGPAGRATIRNSPAAVAWPGGGVAVVAQLSSGQLGVAIQQAATAPGGGTGAAWGAWAQLPGRMLGSPAAWVNSGGAPEVAVLSRQRQIAVSTWSAGSWSAWTRLGGGY